MKYYIFLSILFILAFTNFSFAQNIGITNPSPTEKLHIDSGNIKIGKSVLAVGQSNLLKFGDGDYVSIGEANADDQMTLTASYFLFKSIAGFGGRVGIGPVVGVPTANLEVNGNVKVVDGNQGFGKAFVSDANGLGGWSNAVAFGAHRTSSTINIAGGGTTPLICDAIDYDNNSTYNNTTGQFIAPANGVYHFDVGVIVSSVGSLPAVRLRLRKNLTGLRESTSIITSNTNKASVNLSTDIYLTQGDSIDLLIVNNSFSVINVDTDAGTSVPGTFFNAHLVR
ncbi:MAG: hypothetical protein WCJ85_02950 [Chitinophagaceae bacterium]